MTLADGWTLEMGSHLSGRSVQTSTPANWQAGTIAFLKTIVAAGRDTSSVTVMQTHISIILLAGHRALKLKKDVRLPYVDFSTPDLRLTACERELRLNRRTAPGLYLGVRRVSRQADGSLALDGDGPLVDAVVDMVRFDEGCLFDDLATSGRLTAEYIEALARQVAAFHGTLDADRHRSGSEIMSAVLDINQNAFAGTTVFGEDEVATFCQMFRARLATIAPLLDARAVAGKIRHGHGDLHLRNICLIDGDPTLFDCLEFSDDLATTDILYDLAFLLMDLWARGLHAHANLALNRYLDDLDETDGLPLLPFFMAVRAAVRAHVTATQAMGATAGADRLERDARTYFDLAVALLEVRPTRLVAVGGLSGSGKSTVAASIAPFVGPAPGARVIGSDRTRKRMFRVPARTRLPAEAYLPAVSAEVYGRLRSEAARVLHLGHGVVVDAVFDRPDESIAIAEVAEREGVPFRGLWLTAPREVLLHRVAQRRGDVSDATGDVLLSQVERAVPPAAWASVAADASVEVVCAEARCALAELRTP
ncbi:bifunctional aminoglycoside phosphotransferase/ATP-binding protein [Lichenifustis flavocetrariae]|uniref:AAA family ATPase n=1 Tax=Lichenifustis flavocetrariae TaxID=2949735 RepID=A0AA42CS35_9HYPH|nr:bifunctional aminoglycoside phosphotransferase/ATP-binding protein [Lichenifustis flavocetrariae]MCW6513085.1 AAA family ATPase [Lichenifustis flavocetrariae]